MDFFFYITWNIVFYSLKSVAKLSIATGHAICKFTIVLTVLDNCKFAQHDLLLYLYSFATASSCFFFSTKVARKKLRGIASSIIYAKIFSFFFKKILIISKNIFRRWNRAEKKSVRKLVPSCLIKNFVTSFDNSTNAFVTLWRVIN